MFTTMSVHGRLKKIPKAVQFMMMCSKLDNDTKCNDFYQTAINVCFTMVTGNGGPQMSAKKGIKLYGTRAVAAMFKEYKQLVFGPHNEPVLVPISYDSLSTEQKKQALDALA